MHILAASTPRDGSFAERGVRGLQCPLPQMRPCIPLFLYNTGRFPNQERGEGELLGWRFSQWLWLVLVTYSPAILVLLVTQTRCLCHQKWNPLLATADLNCCWDQTSMTVNQLLSIPLNSILTTYGILIMGCLFQTYTCALLVALGAEKPATRDNGSTVAFSLSGQIPELTSSAIMVHRSNHSDIRW